MPAEDALRTVECLRGRLQAERAASRAAEENAQLMSKKLKELEKQLKIEAKSRRKAEKKLNSLKKKLESLNIPFSMIITEESERSISSNNSETSCMSSIASTSFNHQEDRLPEFQLASKSNSIVSDIAEETESESNVKDEIQNFNNCELSDVDSSGGRQETDESCHGFQQSGLEKKSNEDETEENTDDHHVDDSMALVPVTSIIELNNSSNGAMEVKRENVREVLGTLKQIRESLQSSLEKRRIIKVG